MNSPVALHVVGSPTSMHLLLERQLQTLESSGWTVKVASGPDDGADSCTQHESSEYEIVPLSRHLTPFSDLVALWCLVKLLRRREYDVVHTHTFKPQLLAGIAARLCRVPRILTTIRPYFQDHQAFLRRWFLMLIEWCVCRLHHELLFQNRKDIDRYIDFHLCRENQVRFLGNGIDLRRFDPSDVQPDTVARLKRKLRIPGDTIVVGMVGRYVRAKGYEEFFRIVWRLCEHHSDVVYLTVGSRDRNDLPDGLLDEAKGHRQGRVLGFRHDMPVVYRTMDVFLFCSRRESFPRALMEAGAMGCARVAMTSSGARACIRHGIDGLLVTPKAEDEALSAVASIIADSDQRRAIGKAARKYATAQFDEDRTLARLAAIYNCEDRN